ncbi:MAG: HEAT repeat domain-containing protein [Chloroflexota bacterium]
MALFGWLFRPDIGKLQAQRDIESLIGVLQTSKDQRLRDEASSALVALGSPVVDPLVLAVSLGPWLGQGACLAALAKVRDPQAVPSLIELLGSQNERVREAAGRALVGIGEPATAPLLETLNGQGLLVVARR